MSRDFFKEEVISRSEPCRICGERTGQQIGTVDYWDIKTSKLVRCLKCRHIQLDPMLNDEETAKGCKAYYIEEALRTSKEEQFKNCERNFRRGVVFGYKLKKKKIFPRSVLELGPGTGYFSAGLQFVFPGLQITVMDVNRDVLKSIKEQHGFETIQDTPDNFTINCSGKFDLVIARDILEHVTDISKVIENVHDYLNPNGLFHFITPNGKEDVWGHYLTFKIANTASELLINHVNYFDGKGLRDLLNREGFSSIDYYTYQVKTTLRGKGWKKNPRLMCPLSVKKKADLFIKEKVSELPVIEFKKTEILDKWYIHERRKWMTHLYSLYHHFILFRIPPEINTGHEIYGLFRKA
jgi:2-polyprenyl-3-methyl-5-hydroxy-6-metoxy-1,4-benzoquinol methylase